MLTFEEFHGHLIFEIGEDFICVPLDNPRETFDAESLIHARAKIADRLRVDLNSYQSAMTS